jgi:hypothetical protein
MVKGDPKGTDLFGARGRVWMHAGTSVEARKMSSR